MSRQTLLFALLFLVALAAWQLGDIELAPEPTTKVENYQPDFTAKNLVTTRFDVEGVAPSGWSPAMRSTTRSSSRPPLTSRWSTCSTSRGARVEGHCRHRRAQHR